MVGRAVRASHLMSLPSWSTTSPSHGWPTGHTLFPSREQCWPQTVAGVAWSGVDRWCWQLRFTTTFSAEVSCACVQFPVGTCYSSSFHPSDWRLSASQPSEKTIHKQVPLSNIARWCWGLGRLFDFPQILSWFADVPKLLCPFSLHNMMKQAQARGHTPGDWFGPSQVAMLIR